MNYGLRNKVTGQVEQVIEGGKPEAKKLCRILNKDQRTRAGKEEPVVDPPLHDGERVTYEVVKVDDDGVPVED